MEFEINTEEPESPELRAMLVKHLAFCRELSPSEHVHALDTEATVDPGVSFFGARHSGELLAIGALKHLDPAHGELKSMHTTEKARGTGIGRAMVEHLLSVAAERGYERVNLETGTMDGFAPARRLYRRAGFTTCAPFGQYTQNPYSVCMTIELPSGGVQS